MDLLASPADFVWMSRVFVTFGHLTICTVALQKEEDILLFDGENDTIYCQILLLNEKIRSYYNLVNNGVNSKLENMPCLLLF